MRARRCAPIRIVAELVDVESSLAVGIVATDIPRDDRRRQRVDLLKGDDAYDTGIPSESCTCVNGQSFGY